METRAHHVLIGAFALGTALLAVLFALWVGKISFDEEFDEYEVLFEQSVSGLSTGAAVQFNGIQVGEVRRLWLDREDPRRVLARIRVQGGIPVTIGTRAQVVMTGLTGLAVIRLSGAEPGQPLLTEPAPDRDVPLILSVPSDLDRLMEGSQDVISNVTEATARINELLSTENLSRIGGTLANLESLSKTLDTDVHGTLEEARAAGVAIRQLAERANATVAALEQSLGPEALAELSADTRATLASIRGSAERLSGALEQSAPGVNRFTDEGLPELTRTLTELRTLAQALTRLSRQLEQDPQGWLGQPAPQRSEEPR